MSATSRFRKNAAVLFLGLLLLFVFLDVFYYQSSFISVVPSYIASTLTRYNVTFNNFLLQRHKNRSNVVQTVYRDVRNSTACFVTSNNYTHPDTRIVSTNTSVKSRYFVGVPETEEAASTRPSLPALALPPKHGFSSPYVITPGVYLEMSPSNSKSSNISPTEAVRRNFSIVSTFNAPKWFPTNALNKYNVDLKRCPVKECYIDMKGSLKSVADVLLFFPGRIKVRPQRKPGQIWAFCSWESPEHYSYSVPYSAWKEQFNWTVGYRTDADWFFPNNVLAWRDPSTLLQEKDYVAIAKRKTKMAAWWVSHCKTKSEREKYVKEMQKYIDVDIYGKCGKYKCSKVNISQCEDLLTTDYLFYLSFENSICKDYVSEKFFRMFAYRTHIVPVGRSGFHYNKYIPGNFVVDAANFKSAKSLALHLKTLAADIPRYAKMLQEKDKLVALNRKVDWCDVCKRLRINGYRNRTYKDIKKWSHAPELCRKPGDISLRDRD